MYDDDDDDVGANENATTVTCEEVVRWVLEAANTSVGGVVDRYDYDCSYDDDDDEAFRDSCGAHNIPHLTVT